MNLSLRLYPSVRSSNILVECFVAGSLFRMRAPRATQTPPTPQIPNGSHEKPFLYRRPTHGCENVHNSGGRNHEMRPGSTRQSQRGQRQQLPPPFVTNRPKRPLCQRTLKGVRPAPKGAASTLKKTPKNGHVLT